MRANSAPARTGKRTSRLETSSSSGHAASPNAPSTVRNRRFCSTLSQHAVTRAAAAGPRSSASERVRAARREVTACGRGEQRRRGARDRRQPRRAVAVQPRDRPQQPPGVRVPRVVEQLVQRALLDHLPGVHHQHAVGDVGDDAEVVGDEHDRRARRVAEVTQLAQDLGLDRHVQRGRRLVGDQQLRRARERHRDHHALAHPARELVRVGPRALGRPWDPDPSQQLAPPLEAAPARESGSCARIGSAIWSPTRKTGSSEDIGSWKTIAIDAPRMLSSSRSLAVSSSIPPALALHPRLDRPVGHGEAGGPSRLPRMVGTGQIVKPGQQPTTRSDWGNDKSGEVIELPGDEVTAFDAAGTVLAELDIPLRHPRPALSHSVLQLGFMLPELWCLGDYGR